MGVMPNIRQQASIPIGVMPDMVNRASISSSLLMEARSHQERMTSEVLLV